MPANVLLPNLLPAQCESETMTDIKDGKKIQPFSNWSPRVSATYDLFGTGKTSLRASSSYFYATKITLANQLGGLFTQTRLRWGPNASSGACSASSTGCWTDANVDGIIQVNELIGTPSVSSDRFLNGVLVPAGNIVDPSAKIGRTREAIVGMQHELMANLAVGVDFIYRKYDRGTTNYTIGFQPGAGYNALRALYVPATHTDQVTGLSAQYYQIPSGSRPSGLGNITLTNPNYQIYKGVDLTANKRFSNRWQMAVALTIQDNPQFFPAGSASFVNPTGYEFAHGISTIARYLFKAQGSYTLPWDINLSANFNMNQGATRAISINGPGSVPGGTTGTLTYNTLQVLPNDAVRFEPVKLLDVGVQKVFKMRGGRNRVKIMVDGFNMLNEATILAYVSNNKSVAGFTQPNNIVPPRVFRLGASLNF